MSLTTHTAMDRWFKAEARLDVAETREDAILAANRGAVVPPWRSAWEQSVKNWARVTRMSQNEELRQLQVPR